MSFLLYLTMTLLIIVCLFLILLVLIQKGRGGGLASAFGGGGGNTAFGSKTGDVLTWATSIVFGVFLLLAVVLNIVGDRFHSQRAALPGGGTNSSAPAEPAPPAQTPINPGQ